MRQSLADSAARRHAREESRRPSPVEPRPRDAVREALEGWAVPLPPGGWPSASIVSFEWSAPVD